MCGKLSDNIVQESGPAETEPDDHRGNKMARLRRYQWVVLALILLLAAAAAGSVYTWQQRTPTVTSGQVP